MRAVVIGGSGQVGGWLLQHLAAGGHEAVGTYHSVAYPGLTRLDGSDLAGAAAWVRQQGPDVIFFPAGFTWVDGCERDPARARAANLEQPLHFARTAAELGARFVYFSTDYVFDGVDGPYAEDREPNPINVYGQAKLDAETALAEALGPGLLTVRTCWVYGPERQGKNFAYQVVRTLGRGATMIQPSDMRSSPTSGPDLAAAVLALVERGESGLIDVVGPAVVGRVEFARAIARAFGQDPGGVVGRPDAEVAQDARRPLNGGLLTPRLDSLLPGAMRGLDAALEDFQRVAGGAGPWADPAEAAVP